MMQKIYLFIYLFIGNRKLSVKEQEKTNREKEEKKKKIQEDIVTEHKVQEHCTPLTPPLNNKSLPRGSPLNALLG